jgi:hypothetical protein
MILEEMYGWKGLDNREEWIIGGISGRRDERILRNWGVFY